jgi:hypothetical protein
MPDFRYLLINAPFFMAPPAFAGSGVSFPQPGEVAFCNLILPGDQVSRGSRRPHSGGGIGPLQRLQSELLSKC